MIEGLWTVNFLGGSPEFDHGAGVVIFETQRIFGGDSSFYWTGSYRIEGEVVEGRLQVERHSPGLPGVFESLDSYGLIISGKLDGQRMRLIGRVVGHQDKEMVMSLKRRADLP